MRYVYCVLLPLLLQIGFVYIVVVLNTGNGSWLGLGAILLAIPVVLITAIVNATRTRTCGDRKTAVLFLQSLCVAVAVPLIVCTVLFIAVLTEGLIDSLF